MNKFVFGFFLLIASALFVLVLVAENATQNVAQDAAEPRAERSRVLIGSASFDVRVADTSELRARGLSGDSSISEREGMLFVFEEPGIHGFWMKEMKFPIDIVWISSGRVIGYTENIKQPARDARDEDLPVYYSPEIIDSALEISAGMAGRAGIKTGQDVIIKK